MTPFRVYLINRHFRKKTVKFPSGFPGVPDKSGEIEEIEILLTPIREVKAESAADALNQAYLHLPTFRGRLCVGPLPLVHRTQPERKHAPALAEVE